METSDLRNLAQAIFRNSSFFFKLHNENLKKSMKNRLKRHFQVDNHLISCLPRAMSKYESKRFF